VICVTYLPVESRSDLVQGLVTHRTRFHCGAPPCRRMEIVRSAVGTPKSANFVTSSAWHGHVYFSMPNQWTTMQWTTWFLYLGFRPSAEATATSPRCVMRAPRPGPVVFQTV